MTDVLSAKQRRLNMSRIRGRDTKPELLLRRGLHARGFRYRLHRRDLPGRPDMVFPGRKAVIFAHGCFWHGHSCPMCRLPTTRPEFWAKKIRANQARDRRTTAALQTAGWRVMLVWECALRGPARLCEIAIFDVCSEFLRSGGEFAELAGRWPVGSKEEYSGKQGEEHGR